MELPVKEKFALSIKEAAAYFHIGEKTLRTFAKEHPEVAVFMNRRYIILREEMEALYRRHFAKKEEERVRPGRKEPFQQKLEDAAWYFQMDKKRLRRFAENDANCRFSYYDGTTYWIVTSEFKKYLREMGREAHAAVRQY